MPSIHATLMKPALGVLERVQGEREIVRLVPPAARGQSVEPVAVSWALVSAVDQQEREERFNGTVRTRAVETCLVRVPGREVAEKLPGGVNDSFQVELRGELWPVERVIGIGTELVGLHLERTKHKRLRSES